MLKVLAYELDELPLAVETLLAAVFGTETVHLVAFPVVSPIVKTEGAAVAVVSAGSVPVAVDAVVLVLSVLVAGVEVDGPLEVKVSLVEFLRFVLKPSLSPYSPSDLILSF